MRELLEEDGRWVYGGASFAGRVVDGRFVIEALELTDIPGAAQHAESGLRALGKRYGLVDTQLDGAFWRRMRQAGVVGERHTGILEAALEAIGTHAETPQASHTTIKARYAAGGYRTLCEAVVGSEPLSALKDLARLAGDVGWVLIGGLAMSVYSRPRFTQDIDLLVASEADVQQLAKNTASAFSHPRPHALEHRATGVEIELLTAGFLQQPPELVAQAIASAEHQNLGQSTVPVVSPRYLAALKLQRASFMDMADIERLSRDHGPFDLSDLPLSDKALANWRKLQPELEAPPDDKPRD